MLTKQQLKDNIDAMEKQGASQSEVQEYLNRLPKNKPIDTAQAQEEIAAGQKATEFLKKPLLGQIFSKQFAKELPSATAQTVIGTPAKFIASTAEIPKTILTGKATQATYKLPLLKPFQSFQSEAEQRVEKTGKAMSGIGRALWEVPLAGLETYVAGKYAYQAGKSGINALKTARIKKQIKDTLDVVKPVLTKAERQEAIMRAGKEGGATQKGLFKKFDIAPTQKDYEVADTVKEIVSKNSTPVKNATRLNSEIERIATKELTPVIENNPIKINIKSLSSKFDKIEKPITIKSDKTLNNAFDLMKNKAIDVIKKAKPQNTNDLWKVRKSIDAVVKNELGNIAFDPNKSNAINKAWMEMRRVINSEIADSLPNAGKVFTESMRKMSNMYSALERIGENSQKLLGTDIWTRLWKLHPMFRKAVKYGLPASGITYGVSKIGGD